MIIRADNSYIRNALFPNSNFLNADNITIIDDNSELAEKFIQFFPYGKIVKDGDGNVVDIIDGTPEPVPVPPNITIEQRLSATENAIEEIINILMEV